MLGDPRDGETSEPVRSRFRRGLQTTIAAASAPYGYTLAIWTAGAVVAHERGIPNALGAALYAAGALVGFAVVAGVAFGGMGHQEARPPAPFSAWRSFHVVGVGAAIGTSALVAALLENDGAWALGGFGATVLYLLAAGLAQTFGRPAPEEPRAAEVTPPALRDGATR